MRSLWNGCEAGISNARIIKKTLNSVRRARRRSPTAWKKKMRCEAVETYLEKTFWSFEERPMINRPCERGKSHYNFSHDWCLMCSFNTWLVPDVDTWLIDPIISQTVDQSKTCSTRQHSHHVTQKKIENHRIPPAFLRSNNVIGKRSINDQTMW